MIGNTNGMMPTVYWPSKIDEIVSIYRVEINGLCMHKMKCNEIK